MKLTVVGCNPGEFTVRINGTDHAREFSRGVSPYETAHELARWIEEVTEPPAEDVPAVVIGDEQPETQPEPVEEAPKARKGKKADA